jgi:hypothetical protein
MLGLGVIVGETLGVAVEMNIADEATGLAVLLHPHPHFGGNRFHPFIDGLFRRLPDVAVTAIRFDFASAEPPAARQEVVAALDQASARWTELPVFLVGYSFGAGIAAEIADRRIAGWYLLAPPTAMLSGATIGGRSTTEGDRGSRTRPVLTSGVDRARGGRMGRDDGHDAARCRSLSRPDRPS